VDFNLVPKRKELLATAALVFFCNSQKHNKETISAKRERKQDFCMVKVVLWKTTFHSTSETKTENKREKINAENFFDKSCDQNYALFLHTTLVQSSDPFLIILFWYQPRPKSEAIASTAISQLHEKQELSQWSSVNTKRASSKGDLHRNGASTNNQLFIGTNSLASLPRYFHSKRT